MQNTKDMTVY